MKLECGFSPLIFVSFAKYGVLNCIVLEPEEVRRKLKGIGKSKQSRARHHSCSFLRGQLWLDCLHKAIDVLKERLKVERRAVSAFVFLGAHKALNHNMCQIFAGDVFVGEKLGVPCCTCHLMASSRLWLFNQPERQTSARGIGVK